MIKNFCHLNMGFPTKRGLNSPDEDEDDVIYAYPTLDVNKKTIICFPGGGIDSYKYLRVVTPVVRELLPKENDCDIIVAYYPKITVEKREDNRFKHFISHGGMGEDFVVENPKTYFRYFDEVFHQYFCDASGELLPEDEIAHNLSNLLLFSNCHGSTITAEFVSYLKENGVSAKARHSLKIINYANRGMFHQGETAQVLNINSQLDGFVPDSYIRPDHILSPIFRGVSSVAEKADNSAVIGPSRFAKPYLFLESDNLITLAPPCMRDYVVGGALDSGSTDEHVLKGMKLIGTMNVDHSISGFKIRQLVSMMMTDFVNGDLTDFNSPKYLDTLKNIFYVLDDNSRQYYHLPQQPEGFKQATIKSYHAPDLNKVFVDRVCDLLVRYGLSVDKETNTLHFNNQFFYNDALFLESASKKALEIQTKSPVNEGFFELIKDPKNNLATSIKITGKEKIVSFFENIYFQQDTIRPYSLFKTSQEANAFFKANQINNVFATEYITPAHKKEVLILCISKDKLNQQDISYDVSKGVYTSDQKQYPLPKALIDDIKSVKIEKMVDGTPFVSLPVRPELWADYKQLGFSVKKRSDISQVRVVDVLKINNILRLQDAIRQVEKEREDKINAIKKNKEAFMLSQQQSKSQPNDPKTDEKASASNKKPTTLPVTFSSSPRDF